MVIASVSTVADAAIAPAMMSPCVSRLWTRASIRPWRNWLRYQERDQPGEVQDHDSPGQARGEALGHPAADRAPAERLARGLGVRVDLARGLRGVRGPGGRIPIPRAARAAQAAPGAFEEAAGAAQQAAHGAGGRAFAHAVVTPTVKSLTFP